MSTSDLLHTSDSLGAGGGMCVCVGGGVGVRRRCWGGGGGGTEVGGRGAKVEQTGCY